MDLITAAATETQEDGDVGKTPCLSLSDKPIPYLSNSYPRRIPRHRLTPTPAPRYRECLKNHAANIGAHAVDGCGEFLPFPAANPSDPSSLRCVACGCHRNFHRRDDDSGSTTVHFLSFRRPTPLPLPPPPLHISPLSSPPSPPPPSHILRSLSSGAAALEDQATVNGHQPVTPTAARAVENPVARKRRRTKFTRDQKEKMLSFSERVGWKIQKSDEFLVDEFCNEVGVGKGVLKVWMHNNKHTMRKRDGNKLNTYSSGAGDGIRDYSEMLSFHRNIGESKLHLNVGRDQTSGSPSPA